MKKFILTIYVFMFSSMAAVANAELKIAIVDEIIGASSAYKGITEQVEKKATAFKNNAAKMQEDLQKKYKEIESQKSVLSSEAHTKKTKQFELEAEKAQESTYMERMSLDKAFADATKILEEKITEIIKAKAVSMNLNIVFTKNNMVYNDENLEITDAIIEELNKSMSSIAVKFDSSATKK